MDFDEKGVNRKVYLPDRSRTVEISLLRSAKSAAGWTKMSRITEYERVLMIRRAQIF